MTVSTAAASADNRITNLQLLIEQAERNRHEPVETTKRRTRLELLWDNHIHSDLCGAFCLFDALCGVKSPFPLCSGKDFFMYFDPKDFGKRLQLARKEKGMTQQELADAISVVRDHIGRIERGDRVCSIDLLVELSLVLEVSTDYLLIGKPTPNTAKEGLASVIQQLTQIAENL